MFPVVRNVDEFAVVRSPNHFDPEFDHELMSVRE